MYHLKQSQALRSKSNKQTKALISSTFLTPKKEKTFKAMALLGISSNEFNTPVHTNKHLHVDVTAAMSMTART